MTLTPTKESCALNADRLLSALSNVERLRSELDAAMFELRVAVENAIQEGVSPADVAAAMEDLGAADSQLLVSR